MTVAPLAFVGTGTTGLDAARHDVWELAVVRREPSGRTRSFHAFVPHDLDRADSKALAVGRYAERFAWRAMVDRLLAAGRVKDLTDGAHLVVANPAFDREFLRRLLRGQGIEPGWHYRMVDVIALAAARLGAEPPWDTRELAARLGVVQPDEEKHTAMGDVRFGIRVYDAVYGWNTHDVATTLEPGLLVPAVPRVAP